MYGLVERVTAIYLQSDLSKPEGLNGLNSLIPPNRSSWKVYSIPQAIAIWRKLSTNSQLNWSVIILIREHKVISIVFFLPSTATPFSPYPNLIWIYDCSFIHFLISIIIISISLSRLELIWTQAARQGLLVVAVGCVYVWMFLKCKR